jgi:uncharacterized protein YoxC
VAKHSKIISGLHLDVHQSEVKVNVATARYQSLKRAYNAILDASKIKQRASLRKQQVLHAQHIQKKNEMLKKMWVNVKGTCEMLCEMLAEMNELKRSVKVASTSADKASASEQKAAMNASALFDKLCVSTCFINELKDDINNEMKTIKDLWNKVDKYEEIISWLEHEYEEKFNKYQSTISSINAYYKEVIATNSPWHIMKHWVKNKSRAGN